MTQFHGGRKVTYLGSSVRNREPGDSGIKPLLYGIEAIHVGPTDRRCSSR